MQTCKCCERLTDTRYGVCFDCANFESLIEEKKDMYDQPIEKSIDGSISLNILKSIIDHYKIKKYN